MELGDLLHQRKAEAPSACRLLETPITAAFFQEERAGAVVSWARCPSEWLWFVSLLIVLLLL
ncbi:hypothetical protein [Shinella sp. BYT-45]|uniref:hypothetical protein n=1 Tax=Shinella sp. BYT-45 TaxID=3377377 RepID=UPI00398137F9